MLKILPKLTVATLFFLMLSFLSFADQPPDPGGGPGGGDPVGGGSSLGGGMIFTLILSIGYGARKFYNQRQKLLG
jgi:hypothetical protein